MFYYEFCPIVPCSVFEIIIEGTSCICCGESVRVYELIQFIIYCPCILLCARLMSFWSLSRLQYEWFLISGTALLLSLYLYYFTIVLF